MNFSLKSVTSVSGFLFVFIALVFFGVESNRMFADDPSSKPSEESLIAILKSDAPKAEKAITCKKLAIWGSAACVDEIAKLLVDDELTSWARISLENIPDPAADEALVEALSKVEGRSLVGVINSLGVRKTKSAVAAIAERLQGDEEVAVASALALGKIGDAAAADALLKQASNVSSKKVSNAIAEGLNRISEQRFIAGELEPSISIAKSVLGMDVPKIRKIEATRCLILASKESGVPALIEQLQSKDRDFKNIGLAVARELQGDGVSALLVAAIDDLGEETSSLLILALADRGDASVLAEMKKIVRDGSPESRIAAMEVLKEVGGVDSLEVLLASATDTNSEVAVAATATIAQLSGQEIDQEIVSRLGVADSATQAVLISLIGKRRIDAVEPIVASASSENGEVRAAALTALGQIATEAELDLLVGRAIGSDKKFESDQALALESLKYVAVRLADPTVVVTKLDAAMQRVDEPAQVKILEILAAIGGEKALTVIGKAAISESKLLQDSATQLLGAWMTVDAGPVLLELAARPGYAFRVRSLRGYLRLVRQFLMPDPQRLAMCQKAFAVAERDEEKKLLLEVVQRYPSTGMLELARQIGEKNPQLKGDVDKVVKIMEEKQK